MAGKGNRVKPMVQIKKRRLRNGARFWKKDKSLFSLLPQPFPLENVPSLPFPLTRKGPCSVRKPSRELQPGPPLSQSTRGLLLGSFWDSTNLRGVSGLVGAGGGASSSPPAPRLPRGSAGPPTPQLSAPMGITVPLPARPGRESRGPVVEMLGVGASEVAGVLAERRLLSQPGQTLDLVLIGGCLTSRRPEQQQQQQREERRRQRGPDHLPRKWAPAVYRLPGCVQPSPGRSWRRSRQETPSPGPAPGSRLPAPSLLRPPGAQRGLRDPFGPPAAPSPLLPRVPALQERPGGWKSCVRRVTCAPASRDRRPQASV